ncbi:CKLF-like MARVEL transmembrane domain-containing protein 2 isoform X1 [Sminthopsis crassicaudata]|uniref:CKLF-like MARVEL transmembrane domain-containing protein 2 isoform X1 n=1 Tax=Sminthopsis crassicaudata TaxID=9301 RepID=UPI003D690EF7
MSTAETSERPATSTSETNVSERPVTSTVETNVSERPVTSTVETNVSERSSAAKQKVSERPWAARHREGFAKYRWECKKSSYNYFIKIGSGDLKVLSVILLIVSFILMKRTQTANVFIPVVLMIESFLFFFFIFANILAFPKYLTKMIWPIFDMLNDFFAFIYLAYVGFYSIIHPPPTMEKLYWQVVGLILTVAFLCILDVILQGRHFLDWRTKFGIKQHNVPATTSKTLNT